MIFELTEINGEYFYSQEQFITLLKLAGIEVEIRDGGKKSVEVIYAPKLNGFGTPESEDDFNKRKENYKSIINEL